MTVLLPILAILLLQQSQIESFRALTLQRQYNRLVLKASGQDSSDSAFGSAGAKEELPSLEELFGNGNGVKYVLNNEGSFDTDNGVDNMMIKPSQLDRKKVELIDIPIMPFESPLFPGSREFLFIYEMRFRSLMNDAEKNGNRLGRCFLSDNGAIGSIGSFCSIFVPTRIAHAACPAPAVETISPPAA